MNLPNKLTILRIIMAVTIIILLIFPFNLIGVEMPKYIIDGRIIIDLRYIISGVLFALASFTDFLDGYIARKYDMITDFGKVFDAIADKVLVNSVLVILAANGTIHAIIPVVVIGRDCIVDAIKMVAGSKAGAVAAIKSGKIKAVFLMVGIILTLFYNLPFELWNLDVATFLLVLATILSLVSCFEYYSRYKQFFMPTKESEN